MPRLHNQSNRVVVILNPRRVLEFVEVRGVRELDAYRLYGRVYGHPAVVDGHRALTSRVVGSMSPSDGVVFVYTQNTKYFVVRTQDGEMPMEMGELIEELARERVQNENQTENTQERVAA